MSAVAQIDWAGRPVRLEYAWVGPDSAEPGDGSPTMLGAPTTGDAPTTGGALTAASGSPTLVFLHEGLGSVSAWRDFPARLCAATGCRGLVYSRPGYGGSTPREPGERWESDYLHRQAREVLPPLLDAVGLAAAPIVLFGHSDGATIALLFAATFPGRAAGVVVMAPHIRVEDVTLRGIERARGTYLTGTLREGLGVHHDDPDSAFWGWAQAWLDPGFSSWSIEDELPAIRCPVLAIQGVDDEYGTLEQIRGIARRVEGTTLLEIPGCGHSPHRDAPDEVLASVGEFLDRLRA